MIWKEQLQRAFRDRDEALFAGVMDKIEKRMAYFAAAFEALNESDAIVDAFFEEKGACPPHPEVS